MTDGPEGWEALRKVSVWQTAAALQQEMEAKLMKVRVNWGMRYCRWLIFICCEGTSLLVTEDLGGHHDYTVCLGSACSRRIVGRKTR